MKIYTSFTDGYDAPRNDIEVLPAAKFFDAKLHKICPHLFLKDEITIWCDGNIYLSAENLLAIEEELKTADVVTMTHPHRNCIYEEAAYCIKHGIGDKVKINKQSWEYLAEGYPRKNGLYACGVIARRNIQKINELNEVWIDHCIKWSSRDQISFPFVFQGVKIGTIPFKSVEIRPHLKLQTV
jgi:hypothetical protein